MLYAYRQDGEGLARIAMDAPSLADPGAARSVPEGAIWVDLYRPLAAQVAAVEALGHRLPTPEEMAEIEVSNRLYHEGGAHYLTVVLPGTSPSGHAIAGPVTFILAPARLVTLRHHAPRPFETFPARAALAASGCGSPARIFLGLTEEIVGRLADLMEEAGGVLDAAGRRVFSGDAANRPALLQATLEEVGRQGELLGRIRLAMMTMERALAYLGATPEGAGLKALIRAALRDLAALSVHADFLSSRIGLSVDATLGMINLAQNATVRIVSVVAVLFLPPTLVASVYGMNFAWMPALAAPWGFAFAAGLMLASALGTWLFFKWKDWL